MARDYVAVAYFHEADATEEHATIDSLNENSKGQETPEEALRALLDQTCRRVEMMGKISDRW